MFILGALTGAIVVIIILFFLALLFDDKHLEK